MIFDIENSLWKSKIATFDNLSPDGDSKSDNFIWLHTACYEKSKYSLSLIVIVIYYVSPSVEKAQKEKVDIMSRAQSQFSKKEKVAPIISDVEKERLRQQIDEFDSA